MGEHIDLSDPGFWSIQLPAGKDRALLDPISRTPFDPDAIPRCIQEDTLLYGGLQSLINRAPAVRLETAYTRHVTEADLAMGWRGRRFERQVRRADYFGYEYFGYRIEGPDHYNRVKSRWQQIEEASVKRPITLMGVDISGFLNRRRRAIAQCGSPNKCFPMDVAGVNNSPLERKLIEAQQTLFEDYITDYITFDVYAALCGISNVREWVMLARLGLALQEREGEKVRRLRIFSLFGRRHQDLTRKARLVGIHSEATVKDPNDDLHQDVRTMQTGIVSYSHYTKLNKPIDYSGDD